MAKRVRFCIIIMIFAFYSLCVLGKLPLQEVVKIDLKIKNSKLKSRYFVRFSTEEKKNNFKILASEKNIPI